MTDFGCVCWVRLYSLSLGQDLWILHPMQLFDLRPHRGPIGPLSCQFSLNQAIFMYMVCVVCEEYAFFIKSYRTRVCVLFGCLLLFVEFFLWFPQWHRVDLKLPFTQFRVSIFIRWWRTLLHLWFQHCKQAKSSSKVERMGAPNFWLYAQCGCI